MPSPISNFISTFGSDVARKFMFDVTIPVPLALASYASTGRQLTFRCDSAMLPGRNIAMMDKKIGSAPVEKFPYHTSYNDVVLDFIVNGNMGEKVFFDAWMDLVNPSTDFNFNYKSSYVVDILITQYDMAGNKTYQVKLIDAFPTTVNQMDLAWNSEDFHRVSVDFAYTYWTNTTSSPISLKSIGQTIKQELLTF
jgi:hypothetical protein